MASTVLQALANNEALMQAVKDLLIKRFSVDSLEATNSDIELGQMVRARLVGLKAVEEAFKEIASHRSHPEQKEQTNPGR